MTSPTGARIAICERCGAAAHPGPLLCPRCGGRAFAEQIAAKGVLEEVTTVRHRVGSEGAPTVLGTVLLPLGVRIIVAVDSVTAPGTTVTLEQRGGAIRARASGTFSGGDRERDLE
jgi:uncharacterized OB-fold protein